MAQAARFPSERGEGGFSGGDDTSAGGAAPEPAPGPGGGGDLDDDIPF